MSGCFPDLVIENILRYLPANERFSTRLVSSNWDSTLMKRFRHDKHRVFLRGKTDIKNFVDTFTQAKYGIPFRRFVVSPRETSEEELLVFAKLVGPGMIELSGDTYTTEGGITWSKKSWERARISDQSANASNNQHPAELLKKLELILQHTPNLEYLGIMSLGNNIERCSPIEGKAIPRLPKLRIFSRVPHTRYDGWCASLINQSPLLQNARGILAEEFDLDGVELLQTEPLLVNGYSLKNECTIRIYDADNIKTLETNFKTETKDQMFMRLIYTPSSSDKDRTLSLPFYPLDKISNLLYEETSRGPPPLAIQNGQFPNLRRLTICCSSSSAARVYPFQGCILPTVKRLNLALAMDCYEGWDLASICPNVEILALYIRGELKEYQLWDLLAPFQGSASLNSLTIEDCHRRVFHSAPNVPSWEELLGLGRNHACSGRKVAGFSPLVQSRCPVPNCAGGKGLIFPGVKKLNISDVVLDKFLPLFIRSVRSGSFPAVEKLELNGCTSKDYCATEVPNVEDYKYILGSIVTDVKIESDN